MFRLIVFLAVFNTISAYAQIDEIDVVGLVPGVSTPEQVERITRGIFTVGGEKLVCLSPFTYYIDGKLSQLLCLSGSSEYADTSNNIEAHRALVEGYTKKFGPPSSVTNIPIQNAFGARFDVSTVVWNDKEGNRLTLKSMVNTSGSRKADLFRNSGDLDPESGLLLIESVEQLRREGRDSVSAESEKEF